MEKMPEQLKDFRNFMYIVWKHLNLPDPTPVQYDMADYIQNCLVEQLLKHFVV